jgi:TPP-dependent pyruvate/acetoin dehydrogenase alpha subunit
MSAVTPQQQREMLRMMQTIRRFEERASSDFHAGRIQHPPGSRALHCQGRGPEPDDGRALRP